MEYTPGTQFMDEVRIDKWLWATRVFKTRSLAIRACQAGHVKTGDQSVKPSRSVRAGEVLTIRLGHMTKTVKVLGPLEARVGAKLVSQYLEDLTPPSEYAKRREAQLLPPGFRPQGAGRPTKKDRRLLERYEAEQ